MKIINYISLIAMPLVILLIIINALREKVEVFDIFLKGAVEGLEITLKIFPTLIGLFVAIGMLRSSGVLDFIIKSILSNFLIPLLIVEASDLILQCLRYSITSDALSITLLFSDIIEQTEFNILFSNVLSTK